MGTKKNKREQTVHITLSGILQRVDYDDDVPYKAAIYTDHGEEIFVEVVNRNTKLRKFYNSHVEIAGVFKKVDGYNVVLARRIAEIDPARSIQDASFGAVDSGNGIIYLNDAPDFEGFARLAGRTGGHNH